MVTLTKSRIEALSDGVFSIAMTLLVLKLEIPEVMHHHNNEDMLQQMLALTPQFITYVVTFLIAGGFWFLHHLTFHFVRHVNAFLIWVNLILLMFVSLLPFSAGLMSHLFVHPVSQFFYFGNHLAIALLLALHWEYARRANLLIDTEHASAARMGFRIWHAAAAFAGTIIVGAMFPMYCWTALPVVLMAGWIVEWRAFRRR